jgi:phage terminase small subunit
MNARRERFVTEYVRSGNASAAARDSGYTHNRSDQAGYELLRNPEVNAAIEIERKRALDSVRASASWIVTKAADIAESEDAPHSARVQALSLLAKRHPEFRDAAAIDARTLNLSGLSQEQLDSAIEKLANA